MQEVKQNVQENNNMKPKMRNQRAGLKKQVKPTLCPAFSIVGVTQHPLIHRLSGDTSLSGEIIRE